MIVKSYNKFLESKSEEYSIYDWYFDLRHNIVTYQETKNYSDQFIGPGVFTKIDKKVDEMFSLFEKINLDMIDDMLVDLYDYVPQGKIKSVLYCVLSGNVKHIDAPNTQSKFSSASCYSESNEKNKWDIIKGILLDIIRPTMYVYLEGEDIPIRMGETQYGSQYDEKYSCVNFDLNDYKIYWAGKETSINKLPIYRTEELKNYNVENYINMRQPGLYLSVDIGSNESFNLEKTEDILDDLIPMIKDYLEDCGVQVEEFMFDHTRGRRNYDNNTDIMDYTLKILLKQNKVFI